MKAKCCPALIFVLLFCLQRSAVAFMPSNHCIAGQNHALGYRMSMRQAAEGFSTHTRRRRMEGCTSCPINAVHQITADESSGSRSRGLSLTRILAIAAVGTATVCSGATGALAAYMDPDDVGNVVNSDLPPMWIPLVVVAALSVGISLLQRSLGDVIDDEARLGSISGARAAKQSARDRNMFKKK